MAAALSSTPLLADTDWSAVVSDAMPKLGQMLVAVVAFTAVLLVVFYLAGLVGGRWSKPVAIVVFIGPALVLLAVGLVIPAFRTLFLSFKGAASKTFVGFDNYKWVFTDPDSVHSLVNTVLWILVVPILTTGLGLLLALLIDRMRRESLPKSLIFMPMAISFVGASIIWNLVYAYRDPSLPQIGLLSAVVMKLGWSNPPNWILWEPFNNFLLMVIMIWVQVGFAMVVLSAAIKAIPGEIIEAAAIDGASGLRLFRTVTIPMIRGTLVVVLTTVMITTLKVFDIVRTMTGGNFGTQVLANNMYSQTFVQDNVGRGSALAIVLFLGVVPLIVYNIVQLRKERATR